MELFDHAGHLTEEALHGLCAETLDEMGRLEAAEHLSYCDPCLERYTALLTGDALLQPAHPLKAPVLQRVRRRALSVLCNQYTAYAAAACLALVLWGTGVFGRLMPQAGSSRNASIPQTSASQSLSVPFSVRADAFLRQFNATLQSSFSGWATPHQQHQR